jgi:hypothetical protein
VGRNPRRLEVGVRPDGGLEGSTEEALMENQDAYHNQCNVNTAYEPGLNEQDDREGERGEQLLSLIGQDSLPPEALRNLRSAKTSVTTIS